MWERTQRSEQLCDQAIRDYWAFESSYGITSHSLSIPLGVLTAVSGMSLEAIAALPPPRSGYAGLARPLSDLLKRDADWCWERHHQDTFDDIKASLQRAPVLSLPDETKPFSVSCDASDFAIGWALVQGYDNGHERVISFQSRQLSAAEQNYPVHDKELLAMKPRVLADSRQHAAPIPAGRWRRRASGSWHIPWTYLEGLRTFKVPEDGGNGDRRRGDTARSDGDGDRKDPLVGTIGGGVGFVGEGNDRAVRPLFPQLQLFPVAEQLRLNTEEIGAERGCEAERLHPCQAPSHLPHVLAISTAQYVRTLRGPIVKSGNFSSLPPFRVSAESPSRTAAVTCVASALLQTNQHQLHVLPTINPKRRVDYEAPAKKHREEPGQLTHTEVGPVKEIPELLNMLVAGLTEAVPRHGRKESSVQMLLVLPRRSVGDDALT
ncbi:hypothetical protein ON010_g7954 [Phytophthora cinnamomi]|nr:hypothetical protein ON010_g7954 [Phytophthora cinnamomi]